jgi:hypothetical protein
VPTATLAIRIPGVHVHQQHRDQRDVVRGREREQDEDLRGQPVPAFNRRGEHALDEAVRARARERAGGERNEGERDEEVGDDAVPVEPRVLRADGRETAHGKKNHRRAQPREAPAHRGFQFFNVKDSDRGCH